MTINSDPVHKIKQIPMNHKLNAASDSCKFSLFKSKRAETLSAI